MYECCNICEHMSCMQPLECNTPKYVPHQGNTHIDTNATEASPSISERT